MLLFYLFVWFMLCFDIECFAGLGFQLARFGWTTCINEVLHKPVKRGFAFEGDYFVDVTMQADCIILYLLRVESVVGL